VKISTVMSYAHGFREGVEQVAELEKAGLDHVWIAEAYGFDSPSLMGYMAARTERVTIAAGILPIYTRTPTLIAMTAAGLDMLSDGRFELGLGASGPQVIEGFHGVAYTDPVGRTREIVDICRKVWARDERLVHEGRNYTLPLPADRGTGLGKPLKTIAHPVRARIPIWVASLGEKNVEMTAEVAEGWLPTLFVPEKATDVWGRALEEGLGKRDASLGPLQIAAGGLLAIGEGDDVRAVRELARPQVALYIGGMGAKGHNFYNNLVRRYGYESEAEEIQDLYLDGKKDEAAALVPDELLDAMSMCGPEGHVAERIAAYEEAGVTHLQVVPVPTDGRPATELLERVRALVA
jgi:F420-dependent oxidoreductase-like protein